MTILKVTYGNPVASIKALADTSAALQAVSAAVERSASLGTFCWTRNSKHRIAVLLPE